MGLPPPRAPHLPETHNHLTPHPLRRTAHHQPLPSPSSPRLRAHSPVRTPPQPSILLPPPHLLSPSSAPLALPGGHRPRRWWSRPGAARPWSA
eukprot:2305852-Rhodomonas_salina.3